MRKRAHTSHNHHHTLASIHQQSLVISCILSTLLLWCEIHIVAPIKVVKESDTPLLLLCLCQIQMIGSVAVEMLQGTGVVTVVD